MIRLVRCECSGDPHWVQVADQQYNYKTGILTSDEEVITALGKLVEKGEATFREAAKLAIELSDYRILGLPCPWPKEGNPD